MIQNASSTIELDLRPGLLMNEDGFLLGVRKGYTHRRDDAAQSVTTSNVTRGSIGAFSCTAAGLCTASFTAPAFDPNVADGFDYKVTVNGVESNVARYSIKIRPSAFAYPLSGVTIEDSPLTFNILKQENLGYTHPLNTNATRVEIVEVAHGATAVVDLDTNAADKTCDASGACRLTFTPTAAYSTPDSDLGEAYVRYRVWAYDAEFGVEIPSNTAKIAVNVRPRPKALSKTLVAVQGTSIPVQLNRAVDYSYAASGGNITSVGVVSGSEVNGTLAQASGSCDTNGLCGPLTFNPSTMGDGKPYYGNLAKFDYKAVVYDSYLNANIESAPATITMDIRPLPVAQAKHFKLWQTRNSLLTFGPEDGYQHPYYNTSPTQYRATKIIITQAPQHGGLTGTAGELSCNATTKVCSETFTPESSYFYDGTTFLKIRYKVVVNDPSYGPIESAEAESTIEVKPVPINTGRSVKGVQGVDKPLTLARNQGYTYPIAILPSTPVVTIQNSSNGGLTSPFTCTTSGCNTSFRTSNQELAGAASVEYKLTLNDAEIGAFDTPFMPYAIDFYPTPKAEAFQYPQFSFNGYEGQDLTINLLPGNLSTGALCDASQQALAPKLAYTHKTCDPAVEVLVDNASLSNATFTANPAFTCAAGGVCSGTFRPNSPSGAWLGFGVAQFNYRVRINPAVLTSENLTAAEIAGLTSNPASAQVEFKALPWATGLTLKDINPALDYILAVQGSSRALEIKRCNTPTLSDNCQLGYTHGYDWDASQVNVSSPSNVSLNPFTCAAGICTTLLTPAASFYSANDSNLATFSYNVTVNSKVSNTKQVKVKVYPIPIGQQRFSEGLESEDVNLVVAVGNGYTHPYGDLASKITIVVPPDPAKGSLVNPANTSQLLVPGTDNLDQAFTCVAGSCTAIYRPVTSVGGINSFWYRVAIDGPSEMSSTLKSQLISEQKQYTVKIHPKPVATGAEVVLIENEVKPFNITLNKGFTHEFSAPAETVQFTNADFISLSKIKVNKFDDRGFAQGNIACAGGVCTLVCSSGNCSGVFTPKTDLYSNTASTQFGCNDAGSNCPSIDYKVTVRTEGGLLAQSLNTASLKYNVRRLPRASTSPVSLKATEGETIAVQLKNAQGYNHPFFGATSITKTGSAHGDLTAAFTCATVSGEDGVCSANFQPTSTWVPTTADHIASLSYKVSVNDTTVIEPAQSAATVGTLQSPDTGALQIEYRPKPRATFFDAKAVQDTPKTVTIDYGAGYTQEYALRATKLIIKPSSQSHLAITSCNNVIGCEIACLAGACSVAISPEAGYYGDASFAYEVIVEDAAFSPTRELRSPNFGTATIDVRPKPVPENVSRVTAFETPITLNLLPISGSGYTHPLGYKAKSISVTGAVANGSLTTAFSCDTTPASPNYGRCTAVFTPAAAFYGLTSFTYRLTVFDPVLNADIDSVDKTISIDVRPRPYATGFAAAFAAWENQSRSLVLANGPVADKLGYYYPNEVAPQYDIHPSSVSIDQALSSVANLSSFTCSSGSAAKACQTTLVPITDTFGSSSFDYRINVTDGPLAQTITSNVATINVDVRPIVRSFNTTYTQNLSLKAIQNTPLNWTISNLATQGYTYPSLPAYASVLGTLAITAVDDAAGNGSVQAGASCSAGVCSGVFTPNNGVQGDAKFKFKLAITDTNLPLGLRTYETAEATATVDVYPLPVANDTQFYTVQNNPVTVSLARGTALGYTHLRNHNMTSLNVLSFNHTAGVANSDFTCTNGTCSATFTPTTGFYSASAGTVDAASFSYVPTVTEPGASPRSAAAASSATARITVYPYSVPSTTSLVDIPAWETEARPITLSLGSGLGYTHPWNDPATGINVLSTTAGSTTSSFSCNVSGDCTANFTPLGGTFGSNAASFTYKTRTTYNSLATPIVESVATGTASFNVRPLPKVSAPITVKTPENAALIGQTIGLNAGYTYAESSLRSINKIELRHPGNVYNHATCNGGCGQYTCTTGTCSLPQIDLETDWDRVDGLAKLEYRVLVSDENFAAGSRDKWSNWGTLNLEILPRARGTHVEKTDGIEASDYSLNIGLGTGYTHTESALATKIEIVGSTNISGLTPGTQINCTAGSCPLTLTPISTTFAAISGKPLANDTYGWAEVRYKVLVPVDSQNIWSTQGDAYVYFRPIPKPDSVTVTTAIENEVFPVSIRLKGANGCVSGCGYAQPEGGKATAISVSNPTATVQGTPACVAATGVCTVNFLSATAGDFTFNYKVTVAGLQQATAGLATVTFVPRPRTENLSTAVFEGLSNDLTINRGAGLGYTSAASNNAQDVTITSITNGAIQYLLGGNPTACTVASGTTTCPCQLGQSACNLRYTARNWANLTEIGLIGNFLFKVRDAVFKEADGTTPLSSLNQSTASFSIRPIIRAYDTTYTNNIKLKAIENTPLTWEISNGLTQGYTYPSDASYAAVVSSLTLVPTTDAAGHGTVGATATCTSGVCSGTFTPDAAYTGTASFNFSLGITDNTLPAGQRNYVSAIKTATVDVFPKPVANDRTYYTVQDENISVSLARGANLGYTHLRNSDMSGLNIMSSSHTPSIAATDFSCTSGTCTATFVPSPGYFSSTNILSNAATFDYQIKVTEAGGNPRTATSANTGHGSVMVYPRSVPSAGAGLTNISAWEGEAKSFSIIRGVGLGYTHPWNDSATAIPVTSTSLGSTVSAISCDGSGNCTGTFTPKVGVYGNGAANFAFKSQTTNMSLTTPTVLSASTGTVSFNVRAIPSAVGPVTIKSFENATATGKTISRNAGYTYGDFANRDVDLIEMREYQGTYTHATCSGGCSQYACSSGVCNLPGLIPDTDWDRVDGLAKLEYRVRVTDEGYLPGPVTRWSNWAELRLELLPQARGTTVERLTGIEAQPYALSVQLNDGYTHVESAKATKLKITGTTNISGLNIGDEVICNAAGVCSLTATPILTTFGAVAGKTQPGGTYGWGEVKYQVLVPVDSIDNWSTEARALIYYRPLPKPNDIVLGTAIEDTTFPVKVMLQGSFGCSQYCGYTHSENHKATAIAVTSPTATVQGTPSCDLNGICTVNFYSFSPGTFTFNYKVTVDGLQQATAGLATITFLPRHRTNNLNASTVEGTPVDILIDRGVGLGYTHVDGHNAKEVVLRTITNGTVQQLANGVTPTACTVSGLETICACVSSSSQCIVRFTPRNWADGEGNLTASFLFKTRDISYFEADGTTPLAAKNESTVTISMVPRILANSRSYPEGATQGVEDLPTVVSIAAGSGGISTGGYTHYYSNNATTIRIVSMSHMSITGCAATPCNLTCTAGICNVTTNPLTGVNFDPNGSFTYKIFDAGGYQSHIDGVADVFYYPRPKAVSGTTVVLKNAVATTLQINRGTGYTHALNYNASSWAATDTTNLNGSLTNFRCTNGTCLVDYTPTANYFSASAATPSSFSYSISNSSASGTVTSSNAGTFTMEVFPKPVAATKVLYWVEGLGDTTKATADSKKITIKLGDDYAHDRGYSPKSIEVANTYGGTFTSPFTCAGTTCTAVFEPSALSVNSSNWAASFDYRVFVLGNYDNYPSAWESIGIIVMPLPTVPSPALTVSAVQGRNTSFSFAGANNLAATPPRYKAFGHSWGIGPVATSDIEIVTQPMLSGLQVGTLTVTGCASFRCDADLTISNGSLAGTATFTYRIRVVDNARAAWKIWTPILTGSIDLAAYYTAMGRTFTTQQVLAIDGNGHQIVQPVTQVPLTLALGSGYSQVDNLADIGDVKIVSDISSGGVITSSSITNGVWTATFASNDYWFGDLYAQYRVCKNNCQDANDIKSPAVSDQTKWIHIRVDPNDIPPTPCPKSGADSLIVYKDVAKSFTMTKADDCANGVWYKDMNASDLIVSFKFFAPLPAGTIAGINGTTCTVASGNMTCTCGASNCGFNYTPPLATTGSYTLSYRVTTHSNLINANTQAVDPAALTINVVAPLAPVAQDLSLSTNEDVPLTISLAPGSGYLDAPAINASYLPGPDGYDMKITDAQIVSYDTNKLSSLVLTGCTNGICQLAATPKVDQSGVTSIVYNVVANGQRSANKTITLTINPTDDKPNAYALGATDLGFNRTMDFNDSWGKSEGTFYQSGVGLTRTLGLYPWAGHPQLDSVAVNSVTNKVYGYYDVDGDLATKIRIGTVTGGTINYASGKSASDAFTCDVSGVCTVDFTPNGSVVNGYASFQYWVTTNGSSGLQEQTAPSTFNIYVSGGDTAATAQHMPVPGTQDPDVSPSNYSVDYTIYRGSELNLPLKRGSGEAYNKGQWRGYPYTDWADTVEIGTGSNGAAAPVGLTLSQNSYSCTSSTCFVVPKALDYYDAYPATTSFWYRVVANSSYSRWGYNFGTRLKTASAWKKVTLKVVLNLGVGCTQVPDLYESYFITRNLAQGNTLTFTIGNGVSAGNGYNHQGVGSAWRPLKSIDVAWISGGALGAIDCTSQFGKCTMTYTPDGFNTPGDPNDDMTSQWPQISLRAIDDYGCPSGYKTYSINVVPRIATRNVCEYYPLGAAANCIATSGLLPTTTKNTGKVLTFRKKGSSLRTDYDSFEYETSDNANATKVRLYGFTNTALLKTVLTDSFSGTGVTCSTASGSLVCETTNCDAAGTCRITFNSRSTDDFGMMNFKYKVIVGIAESRNFWIRNPTGQWPWGQNADELYFPDGESEYNVYVKATPVVTNPNGYEVGANDTITLNIGREDTPNGVHGYTYADDAQFTGKDVNIVFLNPVNGSIQGSNFNSTTKIATLDFKPSLNFVGTTTVDYVVTVWGVPSATGTITIKVKSFITGQNVTLATTQNLAVSKTLNAGTEYTYVSPYALNASNIQFATSSYATTIPGTEGAFSGSSCTAGGSCSFTYTPPSSYVGTKAFKYRLESGPTGGKSWTPWYDLTIDVGYAPAPPIVYNMSLNGVEGDAKAIAIMKGATVGDGPTLGYTDINNDLATSLIVSNPQNGLVTPSSPIACTAGMCLVSFNPTAGFYGNATFDFNVIAGGNQAIVPATVTVNFDAKLTASNLTGNGVKNLNKVITVARNSGYTYGPGASVTDLVVSNILPAGSSVTGLSCAAGTCSFNFVPATNFVGTATFNYKVQIKSGVTLIKESNTASASITFAASDTPPVASPLSITLSNRNAYLVTLSPGTAYTDAEDDKATQVRIDSYAGSTSITDAACSGSGVCTFTFSPSASYSGTGYVYFSVMAASVWSNSARITLSIPLPTGPSFSLAWSGTPSLDYQCKIQSPGAITLNSGSNSCGTTACSSYTGTIDAAFTGSAVTASGTGVAGTYTIFSKTGDMFVTWAVANSTPENQTISRFLTLSSATPTAVRQPIITTTPTFDLSTEGVQMPTAGCTGTSCSGSRLGSIASGSDFSCALRADSGVQCWGSNAYGKLGHNNYAETFSNVPVSIKDPSDPNYDLAGATAIAAGDHHACALLSNKRVVCWGDNSSGQLGLGDSLPAYQEFPGFVTINNTGTLLTNVTGLSAGSQHTCAVTTAKNLYCWGKNGNGQLGLGTTTDAMWAKPVLKVTSKASNVVTGTANLEEVVAVSAGKDHTCALRLQTSGATITAQNALCWGANTQKQTGDNDYYANDPTEMSKVGTDITATGNRLYPAFVRDSGSVPITNVVQILALTEASCLLKSDQSVQCWGLNAHKKIGVNQSNMTIVYANPTTVKDSAGTGTLNGVAYLSGSSHTVCALGVNRNVSCWGQGINGELGANSASDAALPVSVLNAAATDPLGNILALAVGNDHVCALSTGGVTKCWGNNQTGELGIPLATAQRLTSGDSALGVDSNAVIFTTKECTKTYFFQ